MAIPKLQAYTLPEPHDIPRDKVDWALELQHTALLIHNVQDYFASLWGENCPMVEQVIVNIVALRDYYKQHNIPVYYTTQSKKQNDEDRMLLNDMWRSDLTRSPEQQKAVGRLTSDINDTVLMKWRYGAFHRSPLEQMLKESGRNQLIITGVYAYIGCMITAMNAFMRGTKLFMVADTLVDFSRDGRLMSLKCAAGRSGRMVMTEELLLAPIPASKVALHEVILSLLDESDEPFDNGNLIDYGLDSVWMMALAARWRKVHGDIDSAMPAKNPTIDVWWKLLSREVK